MFSSFACAHTYQLSQSFTFIIFHAITMHSEEVTEPPAKIPILPFVPPSFDWNASNLYSQFKLF